MGTPWVGTPFQLVQAGLRSRIFVSFLRRAILLPVYLEKRSILSSLSLCFYLLVGLNKNSRHHGVQTHALKRTHCTETGYLVLLVSRCSHYRLRGANVFDSRLKAQGSVATPLQTSGARLNAYYQAQYKRQGNASVSMMTKRKREYYSSLIEQADGDQRNSWDIVNDTVDLKAKPEIQPDLGDQYTVNSFNGYITTIGPKLTKQIHPIKFSMPHLKPF